MQDKKRIALSVRKVLERHRWWGVLRRRLRRKLIRKGAEAELRYGDAEEFTFFPLHQVRSLHASFHGLEDAETVVLVKMAGNDNRLLADDSFPFNFLGPAVGMPDEPMAPEELDVFPRVILDPDEIGEPLQFELKGYRKLKVFNDYRVVYRVDKKEVLVFILVVGIRRDQEVYEEALKRLMPS